MAKLKSVRKAATVAESRYTIAILDEVARDRGRFANFFENDFDVVEIPFVDSVDDLIKKIKANNVDAIAIDYKLKDHNDRFKHNGDFFFKNLMSQLQDFPSFIITQDANRAQRESKLIKPRFIIAKEILSSNDEARIEKFKKEITQEIKAHKSIIEAKMKRIKALEKLKTKGELTGVNENEFIELNNEVSKMITGYSTVPLKYFSTETNKKLDDIIASTAKLLASIAVSKSTKGKAVKPTAKKVAAKKKK